VARDGYDHVAVSPLSAKNLDDESGQKDFIDFSQNSSIKRPIPVAAFNLYAFRILENKTRRATSRILVRDVTNKTRLSALRSPEADRIFKGW